MPQRDPKTGRYISASQYIALTTPVMEPPVDEIPTFARLWHKRCKTFACDLRRDHAGQHAYRVGFEVVQW